MHFNAYNDWLTARLMSPPCGFLTNKKVEWAFLKFKDSQIQVRLSSFRAVSRLDGYGFGKVRP
jgi:hypothetical protein